MSAALREMRHIARVGVVYRGASAPGAVGWLGAVMGVGAVVVMGIAVAKGHAEPGLFARIAIGFAAFWLAIVWSMLFVPGSVTMNSAANARLLPRQRRRLMQMSTCAWLACVAGFGIAFETWGAVLMGGVYLLAFPLLMAGYYRGTVLFMVPSVWFWLAARGPASAAAMTGPAGVGVSCALLLAAAAYSLGVLYPNGGDRQLRMRDAQRQRMTLFAGRNAGEVGGLNGVSAGPSKNLYGASLRRDFLRADPGTMLAHALGPAVHWVVWSGMVAVILAIGVGVRLMTAWGTPGQSDFFNGFGEGVLPSMVIATVFCNAQILQAVRRKQGEQSLLRLTPLAGDAALLNRRLGGRLLMVGLRNCGILTLSLLAAAVLVGSDGAHVLRLAALCCLANQIALAGLLRDYAAGTRRDLMQLVRVGLLVAVEAGVAAGLDRLFGVPSTPLVILFALGATGFMLRRDWRRMLGAPPAFPAGRLA